MSNAPIARVEKGITIFRASAADKCSKALVATLMDEHPAPGSGEAFDRIAKAWGEGHQLEPEIIYHVRQKGYAVRSQQHYIQVPVSDTIVIEGHIDGIAYHSIDQDEWVLECKALSEDSFKRFNRQKWDAYPGYAVQISLYMKAMARPALYAVMAKTTPRQFNIFTIDEPPADLVPVFERLQMVVAWAADGVLPDCDRNDFPCSFNHLHEFTEEEMACGIPAHKPSR